MPLQADDVGDLIAATLRDLGEPRITDITSDLQEHPVMSTILKKNRVEITSGYGIQWDIMVGHSNQARTTGLYATDNVNDADQLIQANAPWRHGETKYAVDRRVIDMNRSPRRIVNLLQVKRYDAMVSWAEMMENKFWTYPASTNDVDPFGIDYWIVKNNTEGFNGGAQTGYNNAVAGVNTNTYPRWKNWTAQYTTFDKTDGVKKLRKAWRKTRFRRPADGGPPEHNTGDKYQLFTNLDVIQTAEEVAESQNDNLGRDLAPMDGEVLFRGTPMQWVPKLDADTTNPIYGVNFGVFKTYILAGNWLRETRLEYTPGQHNVISVFLDCSWNWICKDRRRNFVIATDATYPA